MDKTANREGVMIDNLYAAIFASVDDMLRERSTPGRCFWAANVPILSSVESLRKHGLWMADGDLSPFGDGYKGSVSISLTPGESRIGIFLPEPLVNDHRTNLRADLDTAYDNRPADICRVMGDKVLFDRIYRDAPFSADWLSRAAKGQDQSGTLNMDGEILAVRIANSVSVLWESVCRVLLSCENNNLMEYSLYTQTCLPETIQSLMAITRTASINHLGQWQTLVRTHLDIDTLRQRAKDLLGDDLLSVAFVQGAHYGR